MKPSIATSYIPNICTALPSLSGESWGKKFLRSIVHYATGLHQSASILAKADAQWDGKSNRFHEILRLANVELDASGALPSQGAAVVVANHPTGPMDGIVFGAWLTAQRSDVRILTTEALADIPSLRDWVIPLRLYDGEKVEQNNSQSLRKVLAHLRHGGVIAVFPAGSVELPDPNKNAGAVWKESLFSLALRCQTPIHCVRLHQTHSPFIISIISRHAWIRTLSMGWLFMLMRRKTHRLTVEQVIHPQADDQSDTLRDIAYRAAVIGL